jgi:predicted ATP-grasp superfamily ATP-dependent carboligase
MKRIMVTGTGGSASTNFIRSLRLAPEKIYIVGVDNNKYYIHLSQADKSYLVPNYTDENYIDELNKIIVKEKIEFLHCQPDTELQILSENREKIKCKMFLPSKRAIRVAFNKLVCNQLLRKECVAAPCSHYIDSYKDIDLALSILSSKGHDKFWVRAIKGAGSRAALPVTSYMEAKFWIDYWHNNKDVKYGQFMISEFLPGKEYAFQSIWAYGKLITSMARERIAYLFGARMPSGQSSSPTIAKTVHNEQVNMVATQGIRAIDDVPNGIYCVDLKESKTGVPCITEINAGRFFTTSIFFSQAGCNMPWHYLQSAYGEDVPKLAQYNVLPEDLYWIRQMDCGDKLVALDKIK